MENMNVELVAQMFKNYQSNVLFHLEGTALPFPAIFTPSARNHGPSDSPADAFGREATDNLKPPS